MPPFEHFFPNLYKTFDVSSNLSEEKPDIYRGFKLPIEYSNGLSSVPTSVISDLELIKLTDASGGGAHPIYYYVMTETDDHPQNEFSARMEKEWARIMTTDISYLTDTQKILCGEPVRAAAPAAPPTPEKFLEIWAEVKENEYFLEKYSYLEWSILEPLNRSPVIMDVLSIYNILSPALAIIMPLIMLFVPFFLLKLRGIPITFSVYLDVLREIARHNIIGKTLTQIATNMSVDKIIYLLMTIFFYFMQMYQNTICCIRYYKNLIKVHEYLRDVRAFCATEIAQMRAFCAAVAERDCKCAAYEKFCVDVEQQCAILETFEARLTDLSGAQFFGRIGKMMTCFYSLYKDPDVEAALRYAVGFEAFICQFEAIQQNLASGKMTPAAELDAAETHITEQYYPPLKCAANFARNDLSLEKNAIITGPNASGKTTTLKTTILNILFTQQFGCGFYGKNTRARLYTHIHSYLNIPDTSGRDSLFQAEARRCKEILDIIDDAGATARHFCIFDELFSGTNPVEATQTAQAFLLYLARYENVDFMMTTHYTEICHNIAATTAARSTAQIETDTSGNTDTIAAAAAQPPRIITYMMETRECDETMELIYTYKLARGISSVLGATKVLKMLNYPEEICAAARGNVEISKIAGEIY